MTVVIEDTYFRILNGEEEIATRPRKHTVPITKLKIYARRSNPNKPSNMSWNLRHRPPLA
ncbi:hypothetical protein [Nonomuraea sp. NPDC049141]|uniref:hypothetical protein n=1 Tax=Nonomuraea sp. NPDC049141 TaxID=3155500 RepID=UPI003401FC92